MKIHPDEPPAERSALASPKADLRQLKANSSATVEELQSFLRELKGKSPQEMLGVVACSHLARSCALAAALVFAAIVVFTALPFAFGEKEEAGQPVSAVAVHPAPLEATPPSPAPAPDPQPDADPPGALGVGETKPAPLNENPLENKKDDFLKDLE